MRTVGIICECNPFHSGHRYLMEEMRKSGDCTVVALMSGGFVQRGEAAIADAHTRAKLLLDGGADAVLELPYPYAVSGAEFFAEAGISILEALGVEEVWFGSESGDLQRLTSAAKETLSENFAERYRALCEGGIGTATAFREVLSEGNESSLRANDCLGVAYLRSIYKHQFRIQPHTVKREGAEYSSEELSPKGHPSASAIRRAWLEKGFDAVADCFSSQGQQLLREAEKNGSAPIRNDWLYSLGWIHFRLTPPEALDEVAELGGGLGRRLHQLALESASPEEFRIAVSSKRYPDSRIRRGLLFALTGVKKVDLKQIPAYTVLLAFNEKGRRFLASNRARKEEGFPVVTVRASIPDTREAKRQKELEEMTHALFTSILPISRESAYFLSKPPFLSEK